MSHGAVVCVEDVKAPGPGRSHLVKGPFAYYHYGCDGINDAGWGCGYRTLQSMCSWIIERSRTHLVVPSILSIQQTLVDIGDKPPSFVGSNEWIGSVEVSMVIDTLFNVPCKIVHLNTASDIFDGHVDVICNHFANGGCPLMMGGDLDCSSKGIAGVHVNDEDVYFLIVDPHYNGNDKPSVQFLQDAGWIRWQRIGDLIHNSMYNISLPLTYKKL